MNDLTLRFYYFKTWIRVSFSVILALVLQFTAECYFCVLVKTILFQGPLSQCEQSFRKVFLLDAFFEFFVLTCHKHRVWVPLLLLLPPPLRLIVAASAIERQDPRPHSLGSPLLSSPSPPSFVLSWRDQNLPLRGAATVTPYRGMSTYSSFGFYLYTLMKSDCLPYSIDVSGMTGWFHRWSWCLFRGWNNRENHQHGLPSGGWK